MRTHRLMVFGLDGKGLPFIDVKHDPEICTCNQAAMVKKTDYQGFISFNFDHKDDQAHTFFVNLALYDAKKGRTNSLNAQTTTKKDVIGTGDFYGEIRFDCRKCRP
jgi:hypothetical protein